MDSTYKWNRIVFVFLFLTYLTSMIIFRSSMLRTPLFPFLWLSNIPLGLYTTSLSIHLPWVFKLLLDLCSSEGIRNLPANAGDRFVLSLGWEYPLEKGMATTPVFLPGKSHRQRKMAGYSPGHHKESDTTEWLTLSLSYLAIVYCY